MATTEWSDARVVDLTLVDAGAPEGDGLGGMWIYGARIQHIDADRALVIWAQEWATTTGGGEYFAYDNGATIRLYAQVVKTVPGALQAADRVLLHETPEAVNSDGPTPAEYEYQPPFFVSLEKMDDRLFLASFPIDDHVTAGYSGPGDRSNYYRDRLYVLRVESDDSVTIVAQRSDNIDIYPTRVAVASPTKAVRLREVYTGGTPYNTRYQLEVVTLGSDGTLSVGPYVEISHDFLQFLEWTAVYCEGLNGWIFGNLEEGQILPFHIAGDTITLHDQVTLAGDLPAYESWNWSVLPQRAADGQALISLRGPFFEFPVSSGEFWSETFVATVTLSLASAVVTDWVKLQWQRSSYRPDSDTTSGTYSVAPDGRLVVAQSSDDPNVAPPGIAHNREPTLTIDAFGEEPSVIQAPILTDNAWYGVPPYEMFEYIFGVDVAATNNGAIVLVHGDSADPAYYPDAPPGRGDYSALAAVWFDFRESFISGGLKGQDRRFITP